MLFRYAHTNGVIYYGHMESVLSSGYREVIIFAKETGQTITRYDNYYEVVKMRKYGEGFRYKVKGDYRLYLVVDADSPLYKDDELQKLRWNAVRQYHKIEDLERQAAILRLSQCVSTD